MICPYTGIRAIFPGLLLLATVIPAVGSATDVDEWNQFVEGFDQSDNLERIARFREVVKEQPKNTEARHGLADAAVELALASEVARALGDDETAVARLQTIGDLLFDTFWRVEYRAGQARARALVALGVFHEYGVLTEPDSQKACKAWLEAAEKADVFGRYRAARCVAEHEHRKSVEWMRAAADAGHPAAQHSLAEICMLLNPPDLACATRWASGAAARGRVPAQGIVGWLHFSGQATGITDSQALEYLENAARSGDPTALNNLGQVLESGAGGEGRKNEAAQWYLKAANGGFPPAQYNLGRLYVVGLGVDENISQARLWLTLAEDGGVAQAGEMLDWLSEQ